MLSYACHYNSCSLTTCFFHNYLAHNSSILIVKMADWFVENYEVVWLNEGSHERHSLLLAVRHLAYKSVLLVPDAQHIKPTTYGFGGGM